MSTQDPANQPEQISDDNLEAINGGTSPAPTRKDISFCDLAEISDAPPAERAPSTFILVPPPRRR